MNGCVHAARTLIRIRKSAERGSANLGWLESSHTFSFADDHAAAHMGVGNLRVIDEDRIAPGTGLATHGHRDMEILSHVLDGALARKDSLGNGEADAAGAGVIRPGDVHRMSAGRGVRAGLLDGAETVDVPLDAARLTDVHVARGQIDVKGLRLHAGDSDTLDGEPRARG